jgi:F0F1-type ATP synthase membrane subunit b/b'
MVLLEALGINATLFVQLSIFITTFVLIYHILAKPYFAANMERHRRTAGDKDMARNLTAQTEDIVRDYEATANRLNAEFRSVFDAAKAEALREHERTVAEAKAQAKSTLDKGRARIGAQLAGAKNDIGKGAGVVAQALVSKLLN